MNEPARGNARRAAGFSVQVLVEGILLEGDGTRSSRALSILIKSVSFILYAIGSQMFWSQNPFLHLKFTKDPKNF